MGPRINHHPSPILDRHLQMARVLKGNLDDEGYVQFLQRALAVQEQLLLKVRGAQLPASLPPCDQMSLLQRISPIPPYLPIKLGSTSARTQCALCLHARVHSSCVSCVRES